MGSTACIVLEASKLCQLAVHGLDLRASHSTEVSADYLIVWRGRQEAAVCLCLRNKGMRSEIGLSAVNLDLETRLDELQAPREDLQRLVLQCSMTLADLCTGLNSTQRV